MQIANAARRRGSSRGNFRFQSCQNLAFYTRTSLLCSSETKVLCCNFEYSLSGLAAKLRGPLTYGHGRDERGTGRSLRRRRISPAQSVRQSKWPSLADFLLLEWFCTAGEGASEYGAISLSNSLPPRTRTTDAYRSAFVLSFAIPGLIQTCCTLACLLLVVRFLSIVGGMGEGRTLPNYYSRLWQKGSTRSYDSLLLFG